MKETLPMRKKINAGIDMTPLIDVVFQLLIFLMVSSQFIKPDKQVELPSGAQEASEVEQQLEKHLLTITSENEIIFNGNDTTLGDFSAVLKKAMGETKVKRLEIRGDKSSNLGMFIDIIEKAKVAGIEGLSYHKQANETE